jgi:hypothetical protein
MTSGKLSPSQVDAFEQILLSERRVRLSGQDLWRALAQVFPHRATGPAERILLLAALRSVEARGNICLPSERGRRWDRSMDPAVPTSVDVVREPGSATRPDWRRYPWHPDLHWVAHCRSLTEQQVMFLIRVHEGLVNGAFRDPAPLKYRSLQLTGNEKLLGSLAKTSLFDPARLTLELLGCLPGCLPLAWEPIGDGGRMVIFENAGPFAVARRVLAELRLRPYDLVAYGGGRSLVASLAHLKTINRDVESLHYVGDLDRAGLDIAWHAGHRARELELPGLEPADELHRQMLSAAEAFGHRNGWPARETFSAADRSRVLNVLSPDLRDRVDAMLSAGGRIPEEVLGPDELRSAWS